jgi:hypothetical protein
VLIATEPMTAEIFQGGERLGSSPVSLSVPEGQHVELTLKADGYKDSHVLVDGTEPSLSIKLERTSARPKTPKPVAPAPKGPPAGKRPTLGGGEIIDPWSK